MILLALMLAAAQARLVLVDETVRVPASGWRSLDVLLKQRGAVIECRYVVERGRGGVRIAFMTRADGERFARGRSHRPMISLPYEESGSFRHPVTEPGEYRLIIDNRLEARAPAEVRVRLTAAFGDPMLDIRRLPRERRDRIILISLGLFAGAVLFAAWRIRLAARRRSSIRVMSSSEDAHHN